MISRLEANNINKIEHKITDPYPQFCVVCGRKSHFILRIHYKNEIWNTARFCSIRHFKKIKIPFKIIAKNKYTKFNGIIYPIVDIKTDDESIEWWLEGIAETITVEEFLKMYKGGKNEKKS